ncbi:DNA-directed RNA polymerase subunit M/Transcription elongation factor TFIIS [Microbacterium sp. TS-1]|nr:DNA-directed RNA polymerase subunit M/Transcription elongation factor TFIIS [Microbacterium sp. TS-1]
MQSWNFVERNSLLPGGAREDDDVLGGGLDRYHGPRTQQPLTPSCEAEKGAADEHAHRAA